MERKLIDYLPYVIRDYAEFQGIMGSEQPEIEKAWNTTDDLLDNQFIPTAGNMGLSRWEKILGITPKGTNNFNDVESLLNRVVPQNMVVTLLQLYNTHAELGRFTHAQLAAYTHNQLRNEVLKNGE